jgi:hypothetical protein
MRVLADAAVLIQVNYCQAYSDYLAVIQLWV